MTTMINNSLNVYKKPLKICGTNPVTGAYRDGCCNTGIDDIGTHTVCAVVTNSFLNFSKSMGNDLTKDNPLYNLAQFDAIYLETKQRNYDRALEQIQNMKENNTYYQEQLMILEAEIYDFGLNLQSEAVDIYLNFLELFPQSIFYDLIRIRLRELAL